MADQSTNFTASNGEYRNPFYQGTFEDETIEQMERRLHWAAAAVEAERVVQNNKTATQPVEQGEPVAVLYADGTVLTKAECGDSFAVCCKVQTPLYAAPAPEAVQVEPVAWATRLYNTAYHAGHHDTVEGDYTHVYPQDMDSYHEDIVQEWLVDNPQPAGHGEPVGWYTEDHLDDKSATTYSAEVAQQWRDKGWPVWPLYTTPQPAEREIPGSYPVSGQIFFRGASNEWVLELTGSVNGTTFTARHTQPADIRPEDVAGLPALYETTPDVSALVAIAREIVNLHAKRKVVLTVHVEALEDALANLHQSPTKCPGTGCTDQGCPAYYANDCPPTSEVAKLVEALSRCRHQASYSIGGEDALKLQLEKVRDIASETLNALSSRCKQGGGND